MKRRTVLMTVGALTAAPMRAAATGSTQTDCEETVEITTAESGDEAISTEEVPAAWWEQVERARDVQDEIAEDFGDEGWYEGVGRSGGSAEICGQRAFVVTVYTADEDAARSALGEERDGVDLFYEEPPEVHEDVGTVEGDVNGVEEETETDKEAENGESETNDGETETTEADDDQTPGFGALGALAGLGAARFLLGRRGSDDRAS